MVRLGIAFRLSILLAAFAVLTTGLSGYYTYITGRDQLRARAERDLLTATQVLGKNIGIGFAQGTQNARMLASILIARNVLQSPRSKTAEKEMDEIADVFSAMLETYPEYMQIRLISAADHGREVVRIDRVRGGVTRVSGADLQEKGHFPYVFETLSRSRNGVYVSDITLNHEEGSHLAFEKPTLRIAAAVNNDIGTPIGLIVINLDVNLHFERLQANLPSSYRVYLANQWGDFLIHPDPAKTYGFEHGQRVFIQDAFPQVVALINRSQNDIIVTPSEDTAQSDHDRDIATFVSLPSGDAADNRMFILGVTQPLENILREASRLRENTLETTLLFSLLAVGLAILVARTVTGPVDDMAKAARALSQGDTNHALPVKRNDELGLLARSFVHMREQIVAQVTQLEKHRDELDHLARHDALTGLPNRRMFLEKLDESVAHARRTEKPFAVMFLDLDNFKDINDSKGHAFGDEVLKATAALLRASVRETDTVARLGGDEFVVLCAELAHEEDAFSIVMKLRERMAYGVMIENCDIRIGASIGMSLYPEDGRSAADLLVSADTAMYRSKAEGRTSIVTDPAQTDAA